MKPTSLPASKAKEGKKRGKVSKTTWGTEGKNSPETRKKKG